MGLSQAELSGLLAMLGDRAQEERLEEAPPEFDFEDVRRRIREDLFERQREFFDDREPLKAASCTRQCGKSFEIAREMVDVALERRHAQVFYFMSDAKQSEKVMWLDEDDGLPAVLRSYGMAEGTHFRLNNTSHTVFFPHNRSRIFVGSVLKEQYDTYFRGPKPDLIVFDEAQNIQELERAIAIVTPGVRTKRGRVVVVGTPNPDFWESYFRQVTDTAERTNLGFNVHHWGQVDNTKRPELRRATRRARRLPGSRLRGADAERS